MAMIGISPVQSKITFISTILKSRRYSKEYLSLGFTCKGPEVNQRTTSMCVMLTYCQKKPSQFRRYLDSKHEIERKDIFSNINSGSLWKIGKCLNSAAGCNNENSARVSFKLLAKTEKTAHNSRRTYTFITIW